MLESIKELETDFIKQECLEIIDVQECVFLESEKHRSKMIDRSYIFRRDSDDHWSSDGGNCKEEPKPNR